MLSDERELGLKGGGGGADAGLVSEDSGYCVAFLMDPWTYPTSDAARAQGVDIPVRLVAIARPSSAYKWWACIHLRHFDDGGGSCCLGGALPGPNTWELRGMGWRHTAVHSFEFFPARCLG